MYSGKSKSSELLTRYEGCAIRETICQRGERWQALLTRFRDKKIATTPSRARDRISPARARRKPHKNRGTKAHTIRNIFPENVFPLPRKIPTRSVPGAA